MRRVESYLAGLAHLEYLIRNRQISASQALKLFADRTSYCLVSAGTGRIIANGKSYDKGRAELELAEQAQQRFLTEVYPQVLSLSKQDYPPYQFGGLQPVGRLEQSAYPGGVFSGKPRLLHESRSGLVLSRAHGTFARRHAHADERVRRLPPKALRETDPDAITEQQWIDFLERLTQSKHQVARIYGRYGLLSCRWQRAQGGAARGANRPARANRTLC